MSERFFLATPPVDGRAELVGDEARHLARVLRAAIGDAVAVFDGRGSEWPARVTSIGRDRVVLEVGPPLAAAAPPLPLTLAVALPKGDRQKWLVEKLTELGCARLVPLVTTRGVAEATPAAIERLGRAAIEACKQCGRTMLLEIAPPATLAAVLAARDPGALALVADPAGEALGPLLAGHAGTVLALVGPEGGFTAEELTAAEAAGCRRASLAPHILRVETAAIALAAGMATASGAPRA
jgi:16S rRNA (uracil1498-N3)-methyltransferase